MNDGKTKKPPACDRCKAKRVLCHPNPSGCPRCVEKGVPCTTTPVQRRKRRRASEIDAESGRSTREPTLTLPEVPPTAAAGTLSLPPSREARPTQFDPFPAYEAPHPAAVPSGPTVSSTASQVADMSLMRYQTLPFFRDDASTSQSPAPSFFSAQQQQVGADLMDPVLTPELAMALYEGFRQSTRYDQPLTQFTTLHAALTTNGWFVDLLPPATRALALATFAIGALYTFDAAIIGPSSFTSYSDIEWKGRDLRPYGHRRKRAFKGLRDAAFRAAKENEIMIVPTVDNAACCFLIDTLLQMDDVPAAHLLGARPYYRAYVSHVTALVASGNAPVSDRLGGGTWAIHLSADMWTELCSGRLTLTPEDQKLLLERDSVPDAAAIKKQYRELLATSKLEDWPTATPLCHLFMATARSLSSDLLAPHLRNRDIDPTVLSRLVQAVADLQEISVLHRQLWDRQIQFISATIPASSPATAHGPPQPPPPLFQHANTRRIRWNRLLAAKGVRNFGSFLWTSMIVPLFKELRRRARAAINERSGEVDGGPADGSTLSFAQTYRAEQLKLLAEHVKSLVLSVVETHVELFESAPGMSLLACTSAMGTADAFEQFVDLVEDCEVPRDDRTAALAAGASQVLKVGGWVYSSSRVDHLIDALDELHNSLSSTARAPGSATSTAPGAATQPTWAGPPLPAESPSTTTAGSATLPQIDLEPYAHISAFDPLSPSWLFGADVSGPGGDPTSQAFVATSQNPTSPDLFASVAEGTDWTAAAASGTSGGRPTVPAVGDDAAARLFADLTSQSDAAFVASSTAGPTRAQAQAQA